MVKSPLQSRPLRRLMNERWKPYVRYEKETDRWISKAIRVDRPEDEEVEEANEGKRVQILMTRKELDVIARIIAYMYHDKKDEFKEIASDMRKDHIYKDLRAIDLWLNSQYKRLEKENEQSKQKKRKHL